MSQPSVNEPEHNAAKSAVHHVHVISVLVSLGASEESAARWGAHVVGSLVRCRDSMGNGSVGQGRVVLVMHSGCTGVGIVCGNRQLESGRVSSTLGDGELEGMSSVVLKVGRGNGASTESSISKSSKSMPQVGTIAYIRVASGPGTLA